MKAGTLASAATVSVPRPAEEGARPVLKVATGTTQRVLLVDDSRSIRTLLKIYLMARNFEYVEAESGEEALRVLDQDGIDLVLTDFRMEGMNGAEFAAQLRSNPNSRVARTPILMMTGDPNVAEVRTLGQKAGINAFVRKPVSCAQLMTLVDTILPRNG